MPYQIWHQKKPNVTYLRELACLYGSFYRGNMSNGKCYQKSKQRAFVSYNNSSHSVKYYNAKTRTILISQNFCFLQPTQSNPPEHLIIQPDQVEGELIYLLDMYGNDPSKQLVTSQDEVQQQMNLPKMKQKLDNIDICKPKKMREKS